MFWVFFLGNLAGIAVFLLRRGLPEVKAAVKQNKVPVILVLCAECVMGVFLLFHTVLRRPVMEERLFASAIALTGLFMMTVFFWTAVAFLFFRPKPHLVTAVLIPLLGAVYMMLIPFNSVPDEWYHIPTAYRLSNRFLGIEDAYPDVPMRADDAAYPLLAWTYDVFLYDYRFTPEHYEEYWLHFTDALENEEIVPTENYPPILYPALSSAQHLAPALGLTLGRLLHLNPFLTFLLGRIFSLALFTFLMSWAVKLMPFKKTLLLLVIFMPMMLHQGMSFSYDSFTNALAVWVAAASFYLIYDTPEEKRRRICYYVLLFLFTILLCYCKQHALIAFALFPPYVLYRNGILKKRLLYGALCAAFVLVLGYVLYTFFTLRAQGLPGPDLMADHFTLNYVAHHPLHSFRILLTKFIENFGYGDDMFLECAGSVLGSLVIYIPRGYIMLYLLLCLLALFRCEEGTALPRAEERALMLFTFAVSYFGVVFIHLISTYTKKTAYTVGGIQGRYLLPVIFPFFYALQTKRIRHDIPIDKIAVPAAVGLHFFITLFILYSSPVLP